MRRFILIPALALAGCAATPQWQGTARQFIAQGNCQAARDTVQANAADPGERAAFLGAVLADCDRNMAAAYSSFTLAARYGHPGAQRFLAEAGRPIPSPDLARAPGIGAGEAALILLDGYYQGRADAAPAYYPPAPAAAPVYRCTTRRSGMFGDQARTDCTPQ